MSTEGLGSTPIHLDAMQKALEEVRDKKVKLGSFGSRVVTVKTIENSTVTLTFNEIVRPLNEAVKELKEKSKNEALTEADFTKLHKLEKLRDTFVDATKSQPTTALRSIANWMNGNKYNRDDAMKQILNSINQVKLNHQDRVDDRMKVRGPDLKMLATCNSDYEKLKKSLTTEERKEADAIFASCEKFKTVGNVKKEDFQSQNDTFKSQLQQLKRTLDNLEGLKRQKDDLQYTIQNLKKDIAMQSKNQDLALSDSEKKKINELTTKEEPDLEKMSLSQLRNELSTIKQGLSILQGQQIEMHLKSEGFDKLEGEVKDYALKFKGYDEGTIPIPDQAEFTEAYDAWGKVSEAYKELKNNATRLTGEEIDENLNIIKSNLEILKFLEEQG